MVDYDLLAKCYRQIAEQRGHFVSQMKVLEYICDTQGISKED